MNQPTSPLADALNRDLEAGPARILDFLSRRGRAIYFPFKGILGQSAEAKSTAINATIGTAFEEDGSPLCLECMEDALNLPPETFLYAPSFGLPQIREAWSRMLLEKNPSLAGKSFSLPVVTSALTHGLAVAGYLFLDEGEQVLVPDLYWDNYELVFGHAYGARLVTYNTFRDGGYDLGAFEAALAAAPGPRKVLLLNFPNNPTGYTPTEGEAHAIRDILLRRAEAGDRLTVLLDDAYFGLVYEEGISRESLFPLLCDLHPNVLAVKLDGPTKEDYVWSFRVGFVTFGINGAGPAQYKALESKAAGVVRGGISNCAGISQAILVRGWSNAAYAAQKERKYQVLRARYRRIREILAAHPEYAGTMEPMPFNSGYFMCVRPLGADAEAVRKELLAAHDTGVIMLAGLLRLAFSAVPSAKLDRLFANLHQAILNVRGNQAT
jgi:aspartate/methionine/tyrosine aminotransferase